MFKLYILFVLLFFIFLITIGIKMKELELCYVLASLIVSLLWLPFLIVWFLSEVLK